MLTAGIRHVDTAAVRAAVEAWADVLSARSEVARIVWYGSFISGTPTPRSDADLCVVVRNDVRPAVPRHARGADYVPATPTPVSFDLAVLTAGEYETLGAWAPGWARAIAAGRVLFAR